MKSQLDPESFSFLRDFIYLRSGIFLSDKDAGLLDARLARRLRDLGLSSFGAYAAFLQGPEGSTESAALVDAVTTNYTSFFRDADHFQFLCADVLPRLLRENERAGRCSIRGWSAGCSTGEEAYSIAMSFAEASRDFDRRDFRLLATDINRKVIRMAVRGVYPDSKLARIPQEYFYKYLVRDGETPQGFMRVSDEIRRLILFRRANVLLEPEGFQKRFDFIFCKNVMMYFDQPTQEKLVNRMYLYLRSGGYLFTAPAECMKAVSHGFQFVSPTIHRRP